MYGYDAIDDSYNISYSTALAGLAAARAFADSKHKKLLVIAAGIPELGPTELDGNYRLGQALAKTADHTIVLGSMFAPDIIRGLGNAKYSSYARLVHFTTDTEKFPKAEWVLLVQPELTDLYY